MVVTQRKCYRWYQEGTPSLMTEERIRDLESVEFKWEQNSVSSNERFEQFEIA
jgi:hypothetical protein